MATSFLRRRAVWIGLVLALAGAGVAGYFLWWKRPALPEPGTPQYQEYLETFQVGAAALDVGFDKEAEKKLSLAIELIPGEPAAWANRGLLALRRNQLPSAAEDLKRAQELAPDSSEIRSEEHTAELQSLRHLVCRL